MSEEGEGKTMDLGDGEGQGGLPHSGRVKGPEASWAWLKQDVGGKRERNAGAGGLAKRGQGGLGEGERPAGEAAGRYCGA